MKYGRWIISCFLFLSQHTFQVQIKMSMFQLNRWLWLVSLVCNFRHTFKMFAFTWVSISFHLDLCGLVMIERFAVFRKCSHLPPTYGHIYKVWTYRCRTLTDWNKSYFQVEVLENSIYLQFYPLIKRVVAEVKKWFPFHFNHHPLTPSRLQDYSTSLTPTSCLLLNFNG